MSRVSVWEIDNPGLGKQPLWLRAPPNKRPSLMTLDFLWKKHKHIPQMVVKNVDESHGIDSVKKSASKYKSKSFENRISNVAPNQVAKGLTKITI